MATANDSVTAPYQKAWSAGLAVKVPTSAGSTGMMSPTEIMSISTATMMKPMAAGRGPAPGTAGRVTGAHSMR